MKFNKYTTATDTVRKKTQKPSLSVSECFAFVAGEMAKWTPADLAGFNAEGMGIERAVEQCFFRCGKPYYKVWPGIAAAIGSTKIDIPESTVRLPYPCFEIRLAEGSFLVTESRVPITGLLVYEMEIGPDQEFDGEKFKRMISMSYRVDDKMQGVFGLFIKNGETIEDSLQHAYNRYGTRDSLGNADQLLNKEESRNITRLAIAVALFGIDRHELVLPDIEKEQITVRGKGKKALLKQNRDREIAKNTGWLVGSEIDLPRPDVYREGHGEPTGRELESGHVRSGHMRMQPCGEGNKDRKLIFVPPTVVRPDLPMRTSHGFRIGRPKTAKGVF